MGILLNLGWDFTVDHDLFQLVPPRPDVIHQNLVRSHLVLDRSLGVVSLLQLDALTELVHRHDPQIGLKWKGSFTYH